MKSPVIEYITEEVSRQGHDVLALDGIERVWWMTEAWAHAVFLDRSRKPEIRDAMFIGRKIERSKNHQGIRKCGVRVGNRACPEWQDVQGLLVNLWRTRDSMSPLEFYKEFELIHPFVDGNGRTGKVLLNWLNGTLLKPIFPPADLFGYRFGYPIRNP